MEVNEELRRQNNSAIQSGTTGIPISRIQSMLKMADGNSNVNINISVMQDEVTAKRTYALPTPLQMEIRGAMMSAEQIAEKYYGNGITQ